MWISLECVEQSRTFRKAIRHDDITSIEEASNDSCNFKTKINLRDGVTIYVTSDFDKVFNKIKHGIE